MRIFEQIDRLVLLHKLIQEKRTGTPADLANRLGISRSGLYELINEVKLYHNVSIDYSKANHSFIYDSDAELEIQYSVKVIKRKTI